MRNYAADPHTTFISKRGRGMQHPTRHRDNHAERGLPSRQGGFSLIYIIVVLTVVSALSAGVMALSTSSNYSEVSDRYAIQARYAAISGLNFIRGMHDAYRNLKDQTFDIRDDDGNVVASFLFKDVGVRVTDYQVRVNIIGTAAPGTSHEANYNLITQFQGSDRGRIAFKEDFDEFKSTSSDPTKSPVEVDEVNKRFSVGHGEYNAFGSFVYAGDDSFNFGDNNCTDGECDFRWGIRAFMTTWYQTNVADGLVLTIFNGGNNNWDSVGGHSTHGEMIGYAGDSRYDRGGWKFLDPEKNGIQPPKIGIEIDNWGNNHPRVCGNGDDFPFYALDDGPNSGSRYDIGGSGTNGVDHLAVVLWGLDQEYRCSYYGETGSSSVPDGVKTMDDNTHGFTSQFMDANLAFTEDRATGDFVTLNGTITRVGQAFTLNDVTGMRTDEIDDNQRIVAASFYIRQTPGNTSNTDGNLQARLYTVDNSTTVGVDGIPYAEVNGTGHFTSQSISAYHIFRDGDLDNIYENNSRWRLVTFYFADTDYYSPNNNVSYSSFYDALPKDVAVDPGNYVIVLEYPGGTPTASVDVAVAPKSSVAGHTWPGNMVEYDSSTHTWTADSSKTPVYYVHLYEQAFPFMNNVHYFDGPGEGGYNNYSLTRQRNAIRFEVDRSITPTWYGDEARYKYNIRAWVRRCADTDASEDCPEYVDTVFSDTSGDLNATLNPPVIDKTIYLNTTQHTEFQKAIFGFTEATGGSTQNATFAHFVLQFKRPFDVSIDEVAYPNNIGNFASDF